MSDLITPEMAAEIKASLEAHDLRTINLTQDPELQQKLRNKLDEYHSRVVRGEYGLHSICKAAILAVLLEAGSVTPDTALIYLARHYTRQVSSELESLRRSGASQPEAFEGLKRSLHRTWLVIKDYNATGGQHNHGGTGLKLGAIDYASPLPARQK